MRQILEHVEDGPPLPGSATLALDISYLFDALGKEHGRAQDLEHRLERLRPYLSCACGSWDDDGSVLVKCDVCLDEAGLL